MWSWPFLGEYCHADRLTCAGNPWIRRRLTTQVRCCIWTDMNHRDILELSWVQSIKFCSLHNFPKHVDIVTLKVDPLLAPVVNTRGKADTRAHFNLNIERRWLYTSNPGTFQSDECGRCLGCIKRRLSLHCEAVLLRSALVEHGRPFIFTLESCASYRRGVWVWSRSFTVPGILAAKSHWRQSYLVYASCRMDSDWTKNKPLKPSMYKAQSQSASARLYFFTWRIHYPGLS